MGLVYFMDNITRTPGQWLFNVFFHGIFFASACREENQTFEIVTSWICPPHSGCQSAPRIITFLGSGIPNPYIINLDLPLLLDSTDVDIEKDVDAEKYPPRRSFLHTFFVVVFVTQTLLRGNVARVFSRLCAIALPAKSPALLNLSWKLAKDLVDPTDPGSFNQALILHRI